MKKLLITILVLLGFLSFAYAYADTPGGFTVVQGGTGNTAYGQGWLNYIGTGLRFNASTSPTVNYITSTSTTNTNAFSGKITSGFGGPAAYQVDVRSSSNNSQLHFAGSNVDSGGYLTSAGANNFFTSAGAAFTGSGWVAKSTGSTIIGGGAFGVDGAFDLQLDTGLTVGNTFTPTEMLHIVPTNNGQFSFGNTTSASSANPLYLSLGGTYSTTCGANLKIKLYEDGSGASGNYGLGICGGNLFNTVPAGDAFTWHITGNTPTEKVRIDSTGLGIGKTASTLLDVNGTASIGSTAQTVISTWHGTGDASWIQLPTSGPSGLGFSTPGVSPALAYVKANGDWFAGSLAGDNAYRNTAGQLLFGISTGAANLTMTTSGYLNEKAARYTANTGYQGVINAYSTDALGAGVGGGLILGGTYTAGSQTEFGEIVGAKENATDGNYSGDLLFLTRNNGIAALTEDMRIQGSTGYVGIGTTTPWGILSVAPSNTAGSVPQFVVASSTQTAFIVAPNGNVGVSTSSPFYNFAIGSSTNSAGPNLFSVDQYGSSYFGGQNPALVSCTGGGTCVFATQSTDEAGEVVTSGVVTSITITFKWTKNAAPFCQISIGGANVPGITYGFNSVSSGGFQATFSSSLGTGFMNYWCPQGKP